jgi:hypothetical protein
VIRKVQYWVLRYNTVGPVPRKFTSHDVAISLVLVEIQVCHDLGPG